MNGIVKWFDEKQAIGFIAIGPSEKLKLGLPREKDLFVHRDDVLRRPGVLFADEKVCFEVAFTDKGPRAVNVRVRVNQNPESSADQLAGQPSTIDPQNL